MYDQQQWYLDTKDGVYWYRDDPNRVEFLMRQELFELDPDWAAIMCDATAEDLTNAKLLSYPQTKQDRHSQASDR